jgi:threonine aldolase
MMYIHKPSHDKDGLCNRRFHPFDETRGTYNAMRTLDRREFLKLGGAASLLPMGVTPSAYGSAGGEAAGRPTVQFTGDGIVYSPADYVEVLRTITAEEDQPIEDRYGSGGAVERLEAAFAKVTGKERALFLPTGTMANQLAIKVLSGDRQKVFVQEQSHIYRDEADAAQTVHGKRLMPLAPGKGNFTLEELQAAMDDYRAREVFETTVGAVSIENTVRRRNEEIFDIGEIRRISAFAKANGIGTHLDGARLYMASAYSGVSIREYASYFDTVYISLYKYLRAAGGAILCGSENVMAPIPHLIKVYGGSMFRNWPIAAVALHFLDGFESRFRQAKDQADRLFARLNRTEGIRVERFERGSNVFKLFVTGADPSQFRDRLLEEHHIALRRPPDDEDFIPIKVNESLLRMSNHELVTAFESAYQASTGEG